MATPSLERIFLVGFMGSGKSTIGRHIAADMNWKFVDLDKAFENRHQCTISEYFSNFGEEKFRLAEHELLTELCTQTRVVVATGGGAPCFHRNMEHMNRCGLTIYLQVSPEELTRRLLSAKEQRPLIAQMTADTLPVFILSKLKEREPYYRKAYLVVDSEHLPFSSYKMLINFFPVELIQEYNQKSN